MGRLSTELCSNTSSESHDHAWESSIQGEMIQKDKGLSLLHAPGVPDLAECQADISDFGL
jgi:hypothetical protein